MVKGNNVISFLKKAGEMGKVIKTPAPPEKDKVERVHRFSFEFAYDILRVELFSETDIAHFTWLDKETNTKYKKVEMDYTSLHQQLWALETIKKIQNDKART